MKKLVRIGDKLVKVHVIGELADMLDVLPSSIRKMEERGIMPMANFRLPDVKMANGKVRKGQRIYSDELCKEIKIIYQGITKGKKVTDEQKMKLKTAFAKELETYIKR